MSGWITWITGDNNVDLASAQRVIQELVAERDELRSGAGAEKLVLEEQRRRIQALEETVNAQARQIAVLQRRCSAYCHVLDAEQHLTSALRCIDDAKALVIPAPLIICCPSPRAFAAIASAVAAAAPAAIHVVACSASVCHHTLNDGAVVGGDAGFPAAEVVGVQQFQDLLSTGDVFLHGDASTFAWAYSCRPLEQLQVVGTTALVFGNVQAVARLRQSSLAARCVLIRRVQVDEQMQESDIPGVEYEQLFDCIFDAVSAEEIAREIMTFLEKRR